MAAKKPACTVELDLHTVRQVSRGILPAAGPTEVKPSQESKNANMIKLVNSG
jgi:hypothetical protein